MSKEFSVEALRQKQSLPLESKIILSQQRMKHTPPKQYDYCINKLRLKDVLDFLKVKY